MKIKLITTWTVLSYNSSKWIWSSHKQNVPDWCSHSPSISNFWDLFSVCCIFETFCIMIHLCLFWGGYINYLLTAKSQKLISSWTYPLYGPCGQWSWCSDHRHEGPRREAAPYGLESSSDAPGPHVACCSFLRKLCLRHCRKFLQVTLSGHYLVIFLLPWRLLRTDKHIAKWRHYSWNCHRVSAPEQTQTVITCTGQRERIE